MTANPAARRKMRRVCGICTLCMTMSCKDLLYVCPKILIWNTELNILLLFCEGEGILIFFDRLMKKKAVKLCVEKKKRNFMAELQTTIF